MKSKIVPGSKEAAMKAMRDGYSDTIYYSEFLGTWHVVKGRAIVKHMPKKACVSSQHDTK